MKHRKYLQALSALIVGFTFALGLSISGMTQPSKVLGFLTIDENWDPTLIFVMLGAIPVHALTYYFARRRKSPLLDTQWHVPTATKITKELIIGSLLFGIGWGLAGYCPGPALTSLGSGSIQAVYFVAAMIAGMFVHRLFQKSLSK